MKNLLRLVSVALIFLTASAAAQVSNVDGLTPLEGVPTKRLTNIESRDNQREDKFWEDVKSAGNKKAFEDEDGEDVIDLMESEIVLVVVSQVKYTIERQYICQYIKFGKLNDYGWTIAIGEEYYDYLNINEEVTHWMPFPELPIAKTIIE